MFKKLQHYLLTKRNHEIPNFTNFNNREFHAINSAELNFYNLLILEVEDFFKQDKKNNFKFKIKKDIDPLEGLHESIIFSAASGINLTGKSYEKQLLSRTADLWATNECFNFYLPTGKNKRDLVVNIIKANIYDKSFQKDERFNTYKQILNKFLLNNNLNSYDNHVNNFIDSLKQKQESDILIDTPYDNNDKPALFLSTSRELLSKKEESYISYMQKSNIDELLKGITKMCEYLYNKNDSFTFNMKQQNKKPIISILDNSTKDIFIVQFKEPLTNMFFKDEKEITCSVNPDNLSDVVYSFFRSILGYNYDLMKKHITKEKVNEIVISIDNKELLNILLEKDYNTKKSLKNRL